MLIRVDGYLINLAQRAYDPIWDYFGITKGALLVVIKFLCILTLFLDPSINIGWKGFWTMFFLYSSYRSYDKMHVPQSKRQYKKLNSRALEARSGRMQKIKLYLMIPVIFLFIWYNFSLMNYNIVVVLLLVIFSFYIVTLLIKDRESASQSFSFGGV